MYQIEDFKDALDNCHMEITFDMTDGHYFISDSMGRDGILISGPNNDEYVSTSDEVLDRLLVEGKPMRWMMHMIDPN